MQRLPLDVADEVHHLALARPLTTLVADRDRGADALGEGAGPDDAADVWRDDDNIIGVTELLFDIARHYRSGEEVIGRNIEEALYLTGVQVSVSTRSVPARSIRLATSFAEIGVLGPGLRSWRA